MRYGLRNGTPRRCPAGRLLLVATGQNA